MTISFRDINFFLDIFDLDTLCAFFNKTFCHMEHKHALLLHHLLKTFIAERSRTNYMMSACS
jgi:hypothetical protein